MALERTKSPSASASEANSVQPPVLCLTANSTTTAAVIDLSAWAGKYVSVTALGEIVWLGFQETAAAGSLAKATRATTALNTQTNCMYPLADGAEKTFLVSEQYPYLIHLTDTATATVSVHRA